MERATQPRPPLDTLGLIYSEIADELETQLEQISALNARAQQLLGFAAITVGICRDGEATNAKRDRLVALRCGAAALRRRGLVRSTGLEPARLAARPGASPTLGQAPARHEGMGTASDHPAASIDEKLNWVRWTQRLLALEVVYLVGLIIIRPFVG